MRDAVVETDTYLALSKHSTTARRAASYAWRFSKKVAWIVGTSALVLVVPLLYEVDKELGPSFDNNAPSTSSTPSSTSSSAAAAPDTAAAASS